MEAKYFTSVDTCSCPDFRYRKSQLGLECKHITTLRKAIEIIGEHKAKWATIPGREMRQDGCILVRGGRGASSISTTPTTTMTNTR